MPTPSRALASKLAGSRLRDRGPLLTLDQFIQRQRVLSFYRGILRAVSRVPPSPTRDELRQFARGEFERHRGVVDPVSTCDIESLEADVRRLRAFGTDRCGCEQGHVRYLISSGKTQVDGMMRYVDELAARKA